LRLGSANDILSSLSKRDENKMIDTPERAANRVALLEEEIKKLRENNAKLNADGNQLFQQHEQLKRDNKVQVQKQVEEKVEEKLKEKLKEKLNQARHPHDFIAVDAKEAQTAKTSMLESPNC